MKMTKSLALIGLGAGAVMAYQKYKKPMMKKFEKTVDNALIKTNNKLDEMM